MTIKPGPNTARKVNKLWTHLECTTRPRTPSGAISTVLDGATKSFSSMILLTFSTDLKTDNRHNSTKSPWVEHAGQTIMAIEDTNPLKANRRPAPSFIQFSGGGSLRRRPE